MQRRLFLAASALCAAAFSAPPAFASSGTLQFGGTVLKTCAINVGTPGILDVSGGGSVLSSKTGLGTPALATIVTTGNDFNVDVSNPSSFTVVPLGYSGGVTFDTQYTMTGGTTVLNVTAGNRTLLNIGSTSLSVHLTATRSSPFPAGAYVAQTTVTCE